MPFLLVALAHADPMFALAPAPVEAGGVVATTTLTVGARTDGAVRFLDPTLGRSGVVEQLGAEAGLGHGLAAGAFGLLAIDGQTPVRASGGAWVQARVLGADGDGDGGSLAFRAGVHREFGGVLAASGWAIAGWRQGPVDATLDVQVERRFDAEADPVDLVVPAALSCAVTPGVRVGVEYVGQDLEDLFEEEEEAEGGAVHLAALSVTGVARGGALRLGVSPGVAASARGVGFLGRVTAGWRF